MHPVLIKIALFSEYVDCKTGFDSLLTMSPVTTETALAQPLRSLSNHTHITLRSLLIFFDVEIVENFSCSSPCVENIAGER